MFLVISWRVLELEWNVFLFPFYRARPQYSRQNFVLMTTYPPRELSDAQATLKDASLLNATIMQRIK